MGKLFEFVPGAGLIQFAETEDERMIRLAKKIK